MQMSQADWERWAQQRNADAPKIAKQYEQESRRVLAVLTERGCICNPTIDFDPSRPTTAHISHALDCTYH